MSTEDNFKDALTNSKNSIIEALNKNQDRLYDMFFKVISIPNLITIAAISQGDIIKKIRTIFFLKYVYTVTIISYLAVLMLYVLSIAVANSHFKNKIIGINKLEDELQTIIDNSGILTDELQNKMNNQIKSTPEIGKPTEMIKSIIAILYGVNIVSFVMFTITLIFCFI